jgi:hypothetical protein
VIVAGVSGVGRPQGSESQLSASRPWHLHRLLTTSGRARPAPAPEGYCFGVDVNTPPHPSSFDGS